MAFAIDAVGEDGFGDALPDLVELLHACVHAGASVNFVLPFSLDDSEAFWRRKTGPALADGTRVLLVARLAGQLIGSVQLDTHTPPNQPHRAEITKLLVHPNARRRGTARALMADIEVRARSLGRSLITLDTRTGDKAQPLYASLGYEVAGVIPGYSIDPLNGSLDSTTYMYKTL